METRNENCKMVKQQRLSDIERRSDDYALGSREKLKRNLENKFKKIYITAIQEVENLKLHEDEFRAIRSAILDVGNNQIRNMYAELERYNIESIPYKMEFRVLTAKEKKEIGI